MDIKPLHGGNVYKAARELNIPLDKILDFSANINPLGYPPIVEDIIKRHIRDIVHYPDVEQRELKEVAANYYGTSATNILPGNGSVELINIVVESLRPSKVIIPAPTFAEYSLSCKSRGIPVEFINLKQNNFTFDLKVMDDLEQRLKDNSLLVICNPNNPTGNLVSKDILIKVLRNLQLKNSFLMLDEAFMDFVDKDESLVDLINTHPNLIILKSVTKFFALAGLRLGFVLANSKLIDRFYKLKDPWNINTFATIVGSRVLREEDYIQKTRGFICQEKKWLWKQLKSLPNLLPFFPEANFIFVKLQNHVSATLLADELMKKGILIRNCSNYVYLDDTYFRVAVKSREDNKTLILAIKDIICRKGSI